MICVFTRPQPFPSLLLLLPQVNTLPGQDIADMTGSALKPNAAITRPGLSFKEALLSPRQFPLLKPAPPRFQKLAVACFRCFASDHFAHDCRDPVRCRRCGRSGHMERTCKLPSR